MSDIVANIYKTERGLTLVVNYIYIYYLFFFFFFEIFGGLVIVVVLASGTNVTTS